MALFRQTVEEGLTRQVIERMFETASGPELPTWGSVAKHRPGCDQQSAFPRLPVRS